MKILILSWRCIKNPRAGGSEIYFHELAKKWVSSGEEVIWFSAEFEGCTPREVIDGVQIIRGGGTYSVYLSAWINYMRKNIPHDADVVIDVENGIPFFSPLYIKNKKIVLHVHHVHKDVWFEEMRFPFSYAGYFLESYVMPIVYRKNPGITLSESSADEIISERLMRKKPFIVNPGIEFYPLKKYPKTKKPSVLFLNRIKKYKGIDIFLKAAREFEKKKIPADFWVAGGGDADYIDEMKEYARLENLKNVTFFGRVSEEKKQELMQRAWVFVNPSFKEGWGIVNIEANYSGTPALGSNVGGIKDSIVDGKTGFLFDYGNFEDLAEKIDKIIYDKRLRKKLGSEGKKWARKFDWGSKSKQYLRVLRSIGLSTKEVKYH